MSKKIPLLINSMGLTAFLKIALVIYCVRGQIGESIKGEIFAFEEDFSRLKLKISDAISEFDLLTVALNDIENFNNGGNIAIVYLVHRIEVF